MRALTLINMVGVMAGAIYVGAVFGHGYVPWFGLGSTIAFLGGVFFPFLGEHAELRRGLGRVEEEFQAQKRRDLGVTRSELFTADGPRPVWRGAGSRPSLPLGVATLLGLLLLAADVAAFARHGAVATEAVRTITNF